MTQSAVKVDSFFVFFPPQLYNPIRALHEKSIEGKGLLLKLLNEAFVSIIPGLLVQPTKLSISMSLVNYPEKEEDFLTLFHVKKFTRFKPSPSHF